mmetsp:Transcript_50460/g.80359  ORF Transcript_50460/g.80359 Transcript_50460/m.80359 type:complete len:386 (-) Transcript_50460:117-1274(-)
MLSSSSTAMDVDVDSKQPNTNKSDSQPQKEEKKEAPDSDTQPLSDELNRLKEITIWKAKWNKKEYAVYFDHLTSIGDLKEQLEDETNVRRAKMKLVGLKYQKQFAQNNNSKITDATMVHHLQCKSKKGFLMIGTLDQHAFKDSDISNNALVLDDFDDDYSVDEQKYIENKKQSIEKLEKTIRATTINKIFEPRKGKKLLVLDIDYTIFDMGSKTESWSSLKRPYTEYLMEHCYKHYDIVVWSQTSWRWIEIKLTEMNMLMNDKYKITFVLDKKAMFTIKSNFKSGTKKHYVKPLELIWRKFKGQYDERNTIHIDDLARNFALNPKQGLTIKPYKDAYVNKHTDTELLHLTHYLLLIAKLDSLEGLDHNQWKAYLEKHRNEFANLQ